MFSQVDEEPAIRTNTTILLGNIASYLNEGVNVNELSHLLLLINRDLLAGSKWKDHLMHLNYNADQEESTN